MISSQIGGYVAEVLVSDNRHVAAGEPLLRIDSREYQAQIDQADAPVAQAEAGLCMAAGFLLAPASAAAAARGLRPGGRDLLAELVRDCGAGLSLILRQLEQPLRFSAGPIVLIGALLAECVCTQPGSNRTLQPPATCFST
ncbi:biotin/lipoyl-binding protein [Sphingomonas aracearum]|uniref:biotin/lipoyl-binding protein n=1 Tax=Sphingomonas aracearum TaxID=2283317 RepID=UPI0015F0B253|nr:biotin/lipoyl-binding protein [Sphingomonas aracearum]